MDRYAVALLRQLKPKYGDKALLLLLREIKEMHKEPPIDTWDHETRARLAERITDHLLARGMSHNRKRVMLSKTYGALDVDPEQDAWQHHWRG